ncbi:MAG: phosphodiester glycosidase family protein [Streptosporangiales bacterium]|nr:phosphodiester glycosidase family protein [Streptosporangiales bacterium]MBO0890652.1 phosphodiester glycosidase family protein [Acidothermales bacterium]
MARRLPLRSLALATAVVAGSALLTAPAGASPAASALPLGPAGLSETRTTTTLQPGVTLTRIVRGTADPNDAWTIEISVPAGGNPDPDAPAAALSSRQDAEQAAADLDTDGLDARAERVTTPPTSDYAPGTLGWRVRVGRYAQSADASGDLAKVRAAGFGGSTLFTGWDGASSSGPWHVDVLTVDPAAFRGRLVGSYGADIETRESTSATARAAGATAATNAGFFVLDPNSGAPGDPAGLGVYGGRLLSEATNGRPAFVFHADGRRSAVTRLTWQGAVAGAGGQRLPLDGIDRVPGLIRNCGGTPDDQPTAHPLHDITCTDPDEAVVFTPQYGASTPPGDGVEAVLDRTGRVTAVRSPRGGAVLAGGSTVQAVGADAARLQALAPVGTQLQVTSQLRSTDGNVVSPSPSTYVVNGGPELVNGGRVHVTPQRDGMVHPGDPSSYYGFSHKRNPRTLVGVDARGRTVIVTADGRSTASLGLSITEAGAVAHALGLRDAMNLDGGGSTTMVVGGQVINAPSDATGERPVGDALLVLP